MRGSFGWICASSFRHQGSRIHCLHRDTPLWCKYKPVCPNSSKGLIASRTSRTVVLLSPSPARYALQPDNATRQDTITLSGTKQEHPVFAQPKYGCIGRVLLRDGRISSACCQANRPHLLCHMGDRLARMPGVNQTHTYVIMKDVKSIHALAIGEYAM